MTPGTDRRGMHGELARFGVVGVVTFVADVGTFNLLRLGVGGGGPLETEPLAAKTVSVALATVVAWLGHRSWTFRRRRRARPGPELALFVLANLGGTALPLLCLLVSHHLLDLRSALADNLSANGLGLVLGAAFRFWTYRTFVFLGPPPGPPTGSRPAPEPRHQERGRP